MADRRNNNVRATRNNPARNVRPNTNRTRDEQLRSLPQVNSFIHRFRNQNNREPTQREILANFSEDPDNPQNIQAVRLTNTARTQNYRGSTMQIRRLGGAGNFNTLVRRERGRNIHRLFYRDLRQRRNNIPISANIAHITNPFFHSLVQRDLLATRAVVQNANQNLILEFLQWVVLSNYYYNRYPDHLPRNNNPYPVRIQTDNGLEFPSFRAQVSIQLDESDQLVYFNFGYHDLTAANLQRMAEEFFQVMFQSFRGERIHSLSVQLEFVHPVPAGQGVQQPLRFGAMSYQERKKATLRGGVGLERKFYHSNALRFTPDSDQGWCFPMAFIRAERVTYVYENGKLVDIQESAPVVKIKPTTVWEDPVVPTEEILSVGPHSCNQQVYLFNPYAKRTNGVKEDPTPNQVAEWERHARIVHAHVESVVGESVCHTEETCMQYYADVFQIVIQLYFLHDGAKRDRVIYPKSYVPGETFSSVSLLLESGDPGHVHGITHLRSFVKNQFTVRTPTVNEYCIFCQKFPKGSPEEVRNHMTKCQREEGFQGIIRDFRHALRGKNYRKTRRIMQEGKWITECVLCRQEVVGMYHDHTCVLHRNNEYKECKQEQLYVYDFECQQNYQEEINGSVHVLNLVCMQTMYEPYIKNHFPDIKSFLDHIMTPEFADTIFVAHNGGKYDVHFILQYLEQNQVEYTFVPSPSSSHRFMSLTITGFKITFLDFIFFCPGSLRSIADSFQLSMAKGHFPHLFSREDTQDYLGPLPPRDQEEDYWLQRNFRNTAEEQEFDTWYAEASCEFCICPCYTGERGEVSCKDCGRKFWNLQEQLLYYCEKDVEVLALACQAYRDNMLTPAGDDERGIDPFQMLTLAQVALHTFLCGKGEEMVAMPEETRYGKHPNGVIWCQEVSVALGTKILHTGNHFREYYDMDLHLSFDGYCPKTGHVFWYLDCLHFACPTCYHTEEDLDRTHPIQGCTFRQVQEESRILIERVCEVYQNRIHIMYNHAFHPRENVPVFTPRDCFYGGRTEVFSPYADRAKLGPNAHICYHDVCSLYPYVCATQKLPTGVPTYYEKEEIDPDRLHPSHPNRYFGYVQCHVIPNPQDRIGLLPCRAESGRLQFDLEPKVGCWGTEELYLAMENGYRVDHIYLVVHWGPEESSSTLMRDYIDRFLRDKQEAEGWVKLGASSADPPEEEKLRIQEKLLEENGGIGEIRIDHVAPNKVKRALAKLRLNTLWGKFAQRNQVKKYVTIHSYREFCEIWYNPAIQRDKLTFREIGPDSYRVEYTLTDGNIRPNARANIFIASKVTEWARCILHRKILAVGPERILYCDTDSVIFVWEGNGLELTGIGLGKWTDELDGGTIDVFFALAPKFYITLINEEHHVRAKGVILTNENRNKLNPRDIQKLMWDYLQGQEATLEVSHNLIQSCKNDATLPYGTLYSSKGVKIVRPVISKRVLPPNTYATFQEISKVDTYPIGYLITL